jgi:branched-chain amino acid transport system permease protein
MGSRGAWVAVAVLLGGLPLVFDSVLSVGILNQMLIAVLFALSYNTLLGQGGLLSFGHAVYFGLGGYVAAHAMRLTELGSPSLPLVLLPLAGAAGGLLAAALLGSVSTRRGGTAFTMISLGVGELLAAAALILVAFFGGEAGISADRTAGPALFGVDFARETAVYYHAAVWVFFGALALAAFRQTPAGRMAMAVRDNPLRAQCLGYSAARVRLLCFLVAGTFAGLAGALFAIHNEIITAQALGTANAGQVLLMCFVGGTGYFLGPVIGAVLLTLCQALLSDYTALSTLYLGLLFLGCVMVLPGGLASLLVQLHGLWRRGTLGLLARPLARCGLPAGGLLLSVIGLLELAAREGEALRLAGLTLQAGSARSWLGLAAAAGVTTLLLRRQLPALSAAWLQAGAPGARQGQP